MKRYRGLITPRQEIKKEITDIFNEFFASVFTQDNGITPEFANRTETQEMTIAAVNFPPATVVKTLKCLKPTTSTGPDGIPNILLKRCSMSLAVPLSHLFDTSYKDGVLPECCMEVCQCAANLQKRVL